MTDARRCRCLALRLAVALAAAPLPAAADAVYETRPEWWDDIRLPTVDEADGLSPLQKAHRRGMAVRTALENWYVVGPFGNPGGKGFDTVYPPERRLDPRARYTGKEGKPIAWQAWKAGADNPLDAGLQDFVAYFYKPITSPRVRKTYLVVASADRVAVWLNGRELHRDDKPHALAPHQPLAIEVVLKEGRNDLMVKLSQTDGPWGMQAWTSDQHPLQVMIKSLSTSFDSADAGARRDIAAELARLYEVLGADWPNIVFWETYRVNHAGDERTALRLLDKLHERLESAGRNQALEALYLELFRFGRTDGIRREAAQRYLDVLLARRKLFEVISFTDSYRDTLTDLLGARSREARGVAFLRLGDYDGALAVIEEIRRSFSGDTNARWFRSLATRVEGMRTIRTKMAVDLEADIIAGAARKLEREDNVVKLNRLIRDTLEDKHSEVVPTEEDPLLYEGALRVHKKNLQPYAEAYKPYLLHYLRALWRLSDMLPATLQRKRHQLSLDVMLPRPAKDTSDPLPARAAVPLPPPAHKAFRGLCRLRPGAAEKDHTLDLDGGTYRPYPPPAVLARDDRLFVQNSREVICLREGRVAWAHRADNSLLPAMLDDDTLLKTIVCRPAADAQRVYVRLIENGRAILQALNPRTGGVAWTLPSPYEPTSNPTVWQDYVLAVARQRGVTTEYTFLMINRDTGTVEEELFLFSGPQHLPFARSNGRIQIDLAMPAPVVDRGWAYVATNAGFLMCLNLVDGSVVWARDYRRMPCHVDRQSTNLVNAREPCRPIVGEDTLLFLPLDGPAALLLDKRTGALAAQRADLRWRRADPCGMERALLIEPNGRHAHMLSMRTLETVTRLEGEGWQVIQPLADGAVTLQGGAVEKRNADGRVVERRALPAGFVPLALHGPDCLGIQHTTALPVFGRLAAADAPASTAYSSREQDARRTIDPVLERIGSDLFAVSRNYVTSLGPDGRTRWAFPVRAPHPRIAPCGDAAAVIETHRLSILDRATGSVLKQYPAPGTPLVRFRQHATDPEALYCVIHGDAGWLVERHTADSVRLRGPLTDAGHVLDIYAQGNRLLTADDRLLLGMRYDAHAGVYQRDPDVRRRTHDRAHRFVKFRVQTGRMFFTRGSEHIAFDRGTFHDVAPWTGGKENRRWTDTAHAVSDTILSLRRYPERCGLIDVTTGYDHAHSVAFAQRPVAMGDALYGIAAGGGATLRCVGYRPGQRKTTRQAEVELPGNTDRYRYRWHISTAGAGHAYHVFVPSHDTSHILEQQVLAHDSAADTARLITWPGTHPLRDVRIGNDSVVLATARNLVRLDRETFVRLDGALAPLLETPYAARDDIIVDGFLDEWEADDFHDLNGNALQAVARADDLVLAGTIRDTKLIEAIGRDGLQGRLRIVLMPGATAGLRRDNLDRHGLDVVPGTPGTDFPGDLAVTMLPTGEACHFELRIPYERLARFTRNHFQHIPYRDKRGDIAVHVAVVDGDAEHGLYADKPEWPAMYPRLLIAWK